MILLCSKCWNQISNCQCKNKQRLYICIDDLMVNSISNLNKRHIKTKYCCSGHIVDKEVSQTYICFDRKYQFSHYPSEIKNAKRYVGNSMIEYCISPKLPLSVRQQTLIEVNNEIENWSNNVEIVNTKVVK